MPASLANAKNLRLSTDFPLDKIVRLYEGSFTIAANDFHDEVIPHGLPFIPLPMGNWTMTGDWSLSYDFNTGPIGGSGSPWLVDTSIDADSSGIKLYTTNNTTSSVTFRYRVYCFEPSDQNVDLAPTTSAGDLFVFNNEYNYTKLYKAAVISQGAATSATQVVIHNLGYRPQVAAWTEVSGRVAPVVFTDLLSSYVTVQVTGTSVTFLFNSCPAMRVHYRIYLDE